MHKKIIEWITGTFVIIIYGISIYEKLAAIFILTTFALLLIVLVVVLWKKNLIKKKRLEKVLQENENRALKKEMCWEDKKIYLYAYPPDSLSLSKGFGKCFSRDDERSGKEGTFL